MDDDGDDAADDADDNDADDDNNPSCPPFISSSTLTIVLLLSLTGALSLQLTEVPGKMTSLVDDDGLPLILLFRLNEGILPRFSCQNRYRERGRETCMCEMCGS